MTGKLIVFEGGEGAGKSTQVVRLARTVGGDVLVTRQPGGTPLGQIIRDLVLDADMDISDRAEALLYAADRAQHVDETVRPALDAGRTVISDRWVDSSIAYQAHGRRQPISRITDLSSWATGGLIPDLTILLDIAPETGLARAGSRGTADRLEQAGRAFHTRVRCGYLDQASRNPHRYLVLDATRPADELAADIAERVRALLDAEVGA
jgi:dTMP kinase